MVTQLWLGLKHDSHSVWLDHSETGKGLNNIIPIAPDRILFCIFPDLIASLTGLHDRLSCGVDNTNHLTL